jgi:hypothetical protein
MAFVIVVVLVLISVTVSASNAVIAVRIDLVVSLERRDIFATRLYRLFPSRFRAKVQTYTTDRVCPRKVVHAASRSADTGTRYLYRIQRLP